MLLMLLMPLIILFFPIETNVTSREFVPSSDDSSPERSKKSEKSKLEKSKLEKSKLEKSLTAEPPPAKKPRVVAAEPPVEINVDISSIPAPDPNILPNNPLIPKQRFFGFDQFTG